METKTCTCCKKEYPKTEEYFLLKPIRKNYKWIVHEIFRSNCKKCTYKKSNENRIKKRCIELGIEIKDWDNFKKESLLNNPILQLKNEKLKGLKRSLRARILRKEREENYVFTTLEDYYKKCSENISKAQRKYKYNTNSKINNNIIRESLPDYYIANRLGKSLKDLPKEIIETKRLLITLKRELKNGK